MFKIINLCYNVLFRSLSGKFSLYILSLVLLVTLSLTILGYRREKYILQDNMFLMIERQQTMLETTRDNSIEREREFAITSMENKGKLLIDSLTSQIQGALTRWDFSAIDLALTNSLRDPDIAYIMYVSSDNVPWSYKLSINYYDGSAGKEFVYAEDGSTILGVSSHLEHTVPFEDDFSIRALNQTELAIEEMFLEEIDLPVYDFVMPISTFGQPAGYLRIGFSLREMYSSIERVRLETEEKAATEIKNVRIESEERTSAALRESRNQAYISGVIFVSLGIFVGIALSKKISKPINQMVDAMKKAESGDLRTTVNLLTGDELEKLGDSYNNMINNLSKLVNQVIENAKNVNEIAYSLASSSSESSASIETIANNVVEISRGASDNANMVSITVSNTDELSQSARIINKQVEHALTGSFEMQTIASNGNLVVESVTRTIGTIKEEVNATAVIIDELTEMSQMIGKITETISAITVKTNALAYNVSVSAVKAGKQVKEIVEIGQQVRQLATESSESAKVINDLITNIQTKSRNANHAMKLTAEKTDDGAMLAIEAGQKLNEIVDSGKSLRDAISKISPLVQKQTESTLLIQKSMENIASISKQTSLDTSNASTLVSEQSQVMESVANRAEELKLSSIKLEEQMQQFIIN